MVISVFRDYRVVIFYGSKIETDTSNGVDNTDLNTSVYLLCSINVAAKRISLFFFWTSTINIYVTSLAAIKALNSIRLIKMS